MTIEQPATVRVEVPAGWTPERYRAWLEDELDAIDVLVETQRVLDQHATGSSQLAA